MEPGPREHDDAVRARRRARAAAAAGPSSDARSERFEQRLAAVRASRDRRARLERRLHWALVLGRAGTGVVVALVLVALEASLPTAVLVGAATWVGLALVTRLTARLARQRGAAAWDWQAGRHRLLGRPAARVQQADRPGAGRDRGPFGRAP